MGNQQIQAELESLQRAADAMSTHVVDDIVALSGDWTRFLQGLDRDAWSAEDSCRVFGTAYAEAIEAYDQVLQGVKQDVVRYRDELEATCIAYRSRDDSVRDQMNRHLAALGDLVEGDRMGAIAFDQRADVLDPGTQPAARPAASSGDR